MDGSGPRGGYASIAFPQWLSRLFSPAAKRRHSSRKAKKPSDAVLRCAAGLTAAGQSLPGPRTAIEAAIGAARQQTKTSMAIIGTFTAADNCYTGSVRTLTLNVKVKFVATEKDNDKAPDFRIFSGATECGAVWKSRHPRGDRPGRL
jgi:hypothetical protein